MQIFVNINYFLEMLNTIKHLSIGKLCITQRLPIFFISFSLMMVTNMMDISNF